MSGLTNCKICGNVFIARLNENICRTCLNKQNELVEEIITYVFNLEAPISVSDLIKKYDMSFEYFESLYAASKFIRISDKLIAKCVACGTEITLNKKKRFICDKCENKVLANSDKFTSSESDFGDNDI